MGLHAIDRIAKEDLSSQEKHLVRSSTFDKKSSTLKADGAANDSNHGSSSAHRIVQAHDRAVTAICITHDAVYTASMDSLLKRWSLRLENPRGHQLEADSMVSLGNACLSMAFMSTWLFCGLSNGDIRAFSKDGAEKRLTCRAERITSMMIHEGMLIAGSAGGFVNCWQMKEETGDFVIRSSAEGLFAGQVNCLAATVGALWIGADDGVCVAELPLLRQTAKLEPCSKVVSFLEFQSCVITAYRDGTIVVFDCKGVPTHSQPPFYAGPIACMAGVEVGPKIICGHLNGCITVINLPSFVTNAPRQAFQSCEAACICAESKSGICIIGNDAGDLYVLDSNVGDERTAQPPAISSELQNAIESPSNRRTDAPQNMPEVSKQAPEVSAGEPHCTGGHLCRLSGNHDAHPRGWRCFACGTRKRSEHWACDICNEQLCLACFPWYLPGVRCYDKKEAAIVDCKHVELRKRSANGSVVVFFKQAEHRDILVSKFKTPPVLGGIRIEMKASEGNLTDGALSQKHDCAVVHWMQPDRQGACKLLITTLGHYLDRICDSLTAFEIES